MKNIKKPLSLFLVALFAMVGIFGTITAKSATNRIVTLYPIISNVVGQHKPLLVGNTEKFKVTSKYEGKVQYKAFLFDGKIWRQLSKEYSLAVDAKIPFVLPETPQFKLGKYKLSVWVKRAGKVGTKSNSTGNYDNYYVLDLNCVNKDVDPIITSVIGEHTPLLEGNTEKFTVTSKYEGKVQYKAFLFDGKVWRQLSKEYGLAVDAKTPFVLPETPQFKLGKYKLSVWVKRAGKVGTKSNSSGNYDNYYVLELDCINDNLEVLSID
jgi:hypothetical protein